jgi:hypothetical protein
MKRAETDVEILPERLLRAVDLTEMPERTFYEVNSAATRKIDDALILVGVPKRPHIHNAVHMCDFKLLLKRARTEIVATPYPIFEIYRGYKGELDRVAILSYDRLYVCLPKEPLTNDEIKHIVNTLEVYAQPGGGYHADMQFAWVGRNK